MKPLSWYLLLPLNLVQAAATMVWGAFWISIALVARLLSRSRAPALWLARRVWAPGQVAIGLTTWNIRGRERLQKGRAYLLVANHQSWLDIPLLFLAVPGPLSFVAKKELARVPFLGWYIDAMGMVFVDRSARRRATESVDRARELLARGTRLASFPEGTRSLPGELGRFRSGGFGAAIDAGVDVMPVAILGAGKVLPRDGFAVRPGRVEVRFGEAIPTAQLAHGDRAALALRAEEAVARLLELPESDRGAKAASVRSRGRKEEPE